MRVRPLSSLPPDFARRRWLVTGLATTALAPLLLAAWTPSVQARATQPAAPAVGAPLRVAVAGVVHGHVNGIAKAAQARADVAVVGVYEPDATLRDKFG